MIRMMVLDGNGIGDEFGRRSDTGWLVVRVALNNGQGGHHWSHPMIVLLERM